MPSPIKMRTDYSAPQLRVLAKSAKTNSQSRRMLSLAAVLDGMNRTDAARIGGMDRQTLRDWVHRFNQLGPDGLCDLHAGGVEPRLSADQKAELSAIVDAGPDLSADGVVRWRRIDLQRVIKERFGVDYHERYVGTLLRRKRSCPGAWCNKLARITAVAGLAGLVRSPRRAARRWDYRLMGRLFPASCSGLFAPPIRRSVPAG